jgi:hypothetical protein
VLAYGLLACSISDNCEAYDSPAGQGDMVEPISDLVFNDFITLHGIPSELLGDAIRGPALLNDNTIQLVFDHMVLSATDGQVSIVAVPQSLGYGAAELFAAIDSPILTFFPIQGSMGHNVLNEFHTFINSNGGYSICGFPTTELFSPDLQTNIIRQCFTNLCLDYYPDALEAPVRPVQLGAEYLALNIHRFPPILDPSPITTTRRELVFDLNVWKGSVSINSFTPQTISAQVFSRGVPQSGQNLELLVNLPDGTEQLYYLPPTNTNGLTGITILPILAENNTLIEYQVCRVIEGHDSICVKDSFRIWGNP